jgi:hypothetical protein
LQCPKCSARIASENQLLEDHLFDQVIKTLYPLTHAVVEGVKETWNSLTQSGESFSALCARYDIDTWRQPNTHKSRAETPGSDVGIHTHRQSTASLAGAALLLSESHPLLPLVHPKVIQSHLKPSGAMAAAALAQIIGQTSEQLP